MKNKLLLAGAIALAVQVCACSKTLDVSGGLNSGAETFSGTATGYLDGSGDLQVTTSKGTRCTGNFVYINARVGEGVFKCDDGRGGPFRFVSTGSRGTGEGVLSGERFSFTFG